MIDYDILHKSTVYYENHGFKRVEAPWTVTKAISDITRPTDADEWTIKEKNKVLVASGEQSFLYLYVKGFLPKGKYCTITPCFRNDVFDQSHTKYFMKNELIDTENVTSDSLDDMIMTAMEFFCDYFPSKGLRTVEVIDVRTPGTGKSFDIMYKDVELGSYGIRECEFLKYLYGTGCAEPRVSSTMKKYGIS